LKSVRGVFSSVVTAKIIVNTAREAGAAANHAATDKNTKYSQLSNTHVFVPVAIEAGGT